MTATKLRAADALTSCDGCGKPSKKTAHFTLLLWCLDPQSDRLGIDLCSRCESGLHDRAADPLVVAGDVRGDLLSGSYAGRRIYAGGIVRAIKRQIMRRHGAAQSRRLNVWPLSAVSKDGPK